MCVANRNPDLHGRESGLVEQTGLWGWGPGFRPWGSIGCRCDLEMVEDLADDHRVFDAGDDPHRPAADPTGLDVDAKYALQALCPSLERGRP